MKSYVPTIGLEIHAELKTNTKMFCASKNAPVSEEPNTHICPICMGHPGTLPVVNKKAVESVVMVGCALGGTTATYTEFDRKNYFYPDIPKGYQISQYAYPLVRGGMLLDVAITRVHLEEDTARSQHEEGGTTLVDYNRAGVPLMELVTEPVIHDAQSASAFARELQLLLRTLNVSDADMEKGQMRVEANISVGTDGVLGTKVEVKNLNSFRSVELAIEFEVKRQIEVIEGGGNVVQETRGWDEQKLKTFSQRKKESSHDYRYFPDPDIPKVHLDDKSEINISRIREIMPELPSNKRLKYQNLGLARNKIDVLVTNIDAGKFFDTVVAHSTKGIADLSANYITSDIFSLLVQNPTLALRDASVESFRKLMEMLLEGEVTSRVGKDILQDVVFSKRDPEEIIAERGLGRVDEATTLAVVDEVIGAFPEVVSEYRGGKVSVLQFLIGQAMKRTKGSANPEDLRRLFTERIG